jgi:hypothetical protein
MYGFAGPLQYVWVVVAEIHKSEFPTGPISGLLLAYILVCVFYHKLALNVFGH